MPEGSEVYYKVRDVVRQQGHSESESCRIFKDWHIELRVGSGHVSVWTSQGMVYLTMLDKPVHYKPGSWEEHLSRLHQGRPEVKPATELRELLRAQALESEEDDLSLEETEAQAPAEEPLAAVDAAETAAMDESAESQELPSDPNYEVSREVGDFSVVDDPADTDLSGDSTRTEYVFNSDVILIDEGDASE